MKGYAFGALAICLLGAQIAYMAAPTWSPLPHRQTGTTAIPTRSHSTSRISYDEQPVAERAPTLASGIETKRKRTKTKVKKAAARGGSPHRGQVLALNTIIGEATPRTALGLPPPATTPDVVTAARPPAPSPRKIRGEFVIESVVGVSDFKNREGSTSASGYLGVKLVLSGSETLSARQQYSFDYPKEGEAFRPTTEDVLLNYVKSGLFQFGKGGTVTLLGRIYLPTGEVSRYETKHHGRVSPYLIVSYPLSPVLSLDYHFVPTWINNTRNGYLRDGELQANTDYSLTQFGSLNYAPGKYWLLSQAVGTTNRWLRPVATKGVQRKHNLYLDSSATFLGMRNLTLIGGITQEANIYDPPPGRRVRAYRDSESSYYLTLAIAI